MRSKMTTVTEHEVTLTLTKDELIHLEAAMDYFDDAKEPSEWLGMYSEEYDSDLVIEMLGKLQDIREKLS